MPRVPLPSRTAGLNGTWSIDRRVEVAHGARETLRVRSRACLASSSIVSASALVISRMRYSSRSSSTVFWSKIWKAACLRLAQDLAAVLRVGVVAEVRALVHEALAAHVDDEPERVRVLLEHVADPAVAEGGRVEIPLHGVAGRPVAVGLRADVERHRGCRRPCCGGCRARAPGPSWARGSACATPGWPRSRREARTTARQGISLDARRACASTTPVTRPDPSWISWCAGHPVAHLDADLGRPLEEHLDQARPAAHRLHD